MFSVQFFTVKPVLSCYVKISIKQQNDSPQAKFGLESKDVILFTRSRKISKLEKLFSKIIDNFCTQTSRLSLEPYGIFQHEYETVISIRPPSRTVVQLGDTDSNTEK